MNYDQAEYWSQVANEIEARGGDVFAGDDAPFLRYKRAAVLDRFLGDLPVMGRKVLEVGPGPGGNLTTLRYRGAERLAGVDVSPAMVQLARARGLEVFETDGTTLPFEDREFDLVFSVTVLQHNPRIDALLGEMCRVADQVILVEDTARSHQRASEAYYLRTASEYITVAESLGFELVGVRRLPVYASETMHRAVMKTVARGQRAEGQPIPARAERIETSLLRFTRRLDRFVPSPRVLSRMEFKAKGRPTGT